MANFLDRYAGYPQPGDNEDDTDVAPPVAPPPASPAIPDHVLDKLAQSNPDLIEAYRAKMASSNAALKDAQSAQDMGNYGNVAGRILTDLGNSQKRDVVLGNRIQDLGKAPAILKANRPAFDDSVINNVTAQGVARAKDQRQVDGQDFAEEQHLTDVGQNRADADVARQRAAKSNDPSSDESAAARAYLKQIAPNSADIPNFDKMTEAQAYKIAPGLLDSRKADEANETRKDVAKSRAEELRYRNGILSQSAEASRSAKAEAAIAKETGRMSSDLDPSKGRNGALGVATQKVARADALRALAEGGNLTGPQMEELAIGLNGLISGNNAGAASQIKALVPESAQGSAMKLKEWLQNEPQGLNQQAFVKNMMDTVEREAAVASQQIKKYQVGKLAGYQALKKNNPDAYNQVLQTYGIDPDEIDDKGQYKPKDKGPAKATHGADLP